MMMKYVKKIRLLEIIKQKTMLVGNVGHFAWECPSNESKPQDRYAGKIQHTYTGSTPVTENMWQDLMKKTINATASSMVLANKYKQMKNKGQQAQAAT